METGLVCALMLVLWADLRALVKDTRRKLDDHVEDFEAHPHTDRRKAHA